MLEMRRITIYEFTSVSDFKEELDKCPGWFKIRLGRIPVNGVCIYKGVEESEWIADCFRAPFNLDTLAQGEARLALSEIELEYLNAQAGAILTEDSHGFVKVRLFNTMSDYDSAIREIRSTM